MLYLGPTHSWHDKWRRKPHRQFLFFKSLNELCGTVISIVSFIYLFIYLLLYQCWLVITGGTVKSQHQKPLPLLSQQPKKLTPQNTRKLVTLSIVNFSSLFKLLYPMTIFTLPKSILLFSTAFTFATDLTLTLHLLLPTAFTFPTDLTLTLYYFCSKVIETCPCRCRGKEEGREGECWKLCILYWPIHYGVI